MKFGTPKKHTPTFKFGKPQIFDETLANNIVSELGCKKSEFISEVQNDIESYIKNLSPSECLTLVSRYSDGSICCHWYPSEVLDGYTGRMIAFLREKKYEDKTIDSALTDPVVNIVSERFNKFYSDNSVTISKPLLDQILKDKVFVSQLSNQIVEISGGIIPIYIKSELSKSIVHYIEDNIQTNIVHSSASQIQHLASSIVSHATAVPITTAISAVLVKNMAIFMKGIIAKVLATSAAKTMLIGVVKKVVAAKIIAAFVAILGPVLGGVSVIYIVAPLLAAYIAYEISNLPNELADKVSTAVANELSGKFNNINKGMATQLVQSMSLGLFSSFANDIVHDQAFKDLVEEMKKGINH